MSLIIGGQCKKAIAMQNPLIYITPFTLRRVSWHVIVVVLGNGTKGVNDTGAVARE